MKIVCISDTHLRHKRFPVDVPEADILIHAGDACIEGTLPEVKEFFAWWETLKARRKVFVPGNHDWLFQKAPDLARSCIPPGTVLLQDSMAEVEGLKIFGSPWQPEFNNWAFNLSRGWPLKQKWQAIPEGIDILVTHGPPMGIMDWSQYQKEHVGCGDLREELHRIKPALHVFGHIHRDYGTLYREGTLFVNASICDEAYIPTHDPIVVEHTPEIGFTVLSGPKKKLVKDRRAAPLW